MKTICDCGKNLSIQGSVKREVYIHGLHIPPTTFTGHLKNNTFYPDDSHFYHTIKAATSAFYSEDRCGHCRRILRGSK